MGKHRMVVHRAVAPLDQIRCKLIRVDLRIDSLGARHDFQLDIYFFVAFDGALSSDGGKFASTIAAVVSGAVRSLIKITRSQVIMTRQIYMFPN